MKTIDEIPQDLIDLIERSDSLAILSHKNSDGDSLGSVIALERALTKIGKHIHIPAPTTFPQRYSFMHKYSNGWGNFPNKVDAIISVDCSTPDRIDWGEFQRPEGIPLANIDHHDGNQNFGDINWVKPSAAAAGVLVYKLIRSLDIPIDKETASALYVAIMTDTGRFSFSNTNPDALRIASELIEFGAEPKYLTTEVYFNFSEGYMRNIGIALFNSRSFHRGRILFLTLDRATMRSFSTSPDDSEGIIDFAMSVRNVDVAALFKEITSNKIRVSLRSRRGINVAKVAEHFGGGGHPNAAGCTISDNLVMAQTAVLENIRKLLGYR